MISFERFALEDSGPVYLQIMRYIRQGIAAGVIGDREEVPSRRALSTLLGVNPNTIQKAFAVLEQEGYIFSVKGRGNFVSESASLFEKKKESCLEDLRLLLFHAKELGILEPDCMAVIAQVYG